MIDERKLRRILKYLHEHLWTRGQRDDLLSTLEMHCWPTARSQDQ